MARKIEQTEFGKRLQKLREKKGWTLHELSWEARIMEHKLRRWEKGGSLPRLSDDLLRLVLVLDTSVDWFLFGKQPKKKP